MASFVGRVKSQNSLALAWHVLLIISVIFNRKKSQQSRNYAVKFEFSTPEKPLFIWNAWNWNQEKARERSVRKEMNSNKNKIKYFCEQFENFPLILSLCYCSHSCCCQSSSSSLRKSFLLPSFFSLYAISFHNCSHLHCACSTSSEYNKL